MNYLEKYNSIILKAKSKNRIKNCGIYYEKHHILPKCLGGDNSKNNLVLLTAREHFIAHKLLTYIYKGHRGIALAFHRMSFSKNIKYRISSRDYEYAKLLIKSIPISEETKQKIRLSTKGINKGKNNGMFGKHISNKNKNAIKLKQENKIVSKETKDKQSINQKGKNNSMFGKPAWNAINKIIKICEYCKIETTIGNYVRWHGERCKYRI
jgi:hypothetical protein